MLEIAKREREEENIRGRKPIKKFSVGLDNSTEARGSLVHQLGRSLQLSKNKRKRGVFKQKKRGSIDPSTLSLSLCSLFYKIKTKTKHTGLLYFYGHVHTHTHAGQQHTHTQAANSFSTLPDKLLDGCCYCVKLHTHRQTHAHAEFNCAASRKCHISGRVRRFF